MLFLVNDTAAEEMFGNHKTTGSLFCCLLSDDLPLKLNQLNDEKIKSLKRESNDELDSQITEKGIQSLIISLRNNKECGFDKM